MNALTVVKVLGPIDGRNLRRDPMLRWMVLLPLFLALLLRLALPWATTRIEEQFGVVVRPYFPILYGYMVLICPVMYGIVVGFLLLDERDDQTLTALQVTPLPLTHYTAYRIGVPMLIGIAITPITMWLVGIYNLTLAEMMLIAVVAAPLAPFYMFLLADFAANKVQGLALMKASGILLIAPLLAWFVPMPWQLFFGLMPTYWPVKIFWMLGAGESGVWAYIVTGLLLQCLLVYALLRRFNKVIHR